MQKNDLTENKTAKEIKRLTSVITLIAMICGGVWLNKKWEEKRQIERANAEIQKTNIQLENAGQKFREQMETLIPKNAQP